MRVITEAIAKSLVSIPHAISAVEKAFADFDSEKSSLFPVVSGRGEQPGTRFGIKSAFDGTRLTAGLKVGTYWPGNRTKGLESHSSLTLFLDRHTGYPSALISSSYLTALRTAAADAIAVKYLARKNASQVGVIGAGHQAFYDVLAIRCVREVSSVLVWSRQGKTASEFVTKLRGEGITSTEASLEDTVGGAEVLVTATPSTTALVKMDWVSPGTHISAMGADAPGKQELATDLVQSAKLYADVPQQSKTIGEFQSAYREGKIKDDRISPIGSVINGRQSGRQSDDEITIFDSSGMGLQDLAICGLALDLAVDRGLAIELDLQDAQPHVTRGSADQRA